MDRSTELQARLAHLTVDVSAAALTTVWPDWRDDDYVPAYNKFYFFLDGAGSLRIDGTDYSPKPGELYLMPSGIRQSYATDPDRPFTKYWCHFAARIGDRSLFELVKAPAFVRVPDAPALSELFRRLVDRQEGQDLVSLLGRKAALLEIICRFLEWSGSDLRLFALDSDDRLRRVLTYMEENLAKPVSVEELADIAHLQKNYLIGRFRKAFGLPPIRYLNLRRVELAKELLSQSGASVSEIAGLAGFGDAFNFSRSFKDHTGYSPSAWRSLHERTMD